MKPAELIIFRAPLDNRLRFSVINQDHDALGASDGANSVSIRLGDKSPAKEAHMYKRDGNGMAKGIRHQKGVSVGIVEKPRTYIFLVERYLYRFPWGAEIVDSPEIHLELIALINDLVGVADEIIITDARYDIPLIYVIRRLIHLAIAFTFAVCSALINDVHIGKLIIPTL